MSEYINADCMDYLPSYADGEFDLAIVDPPYGGGAVDDADDAFKGAVVGRFGGRFAKYDLGGGTGDKGCSDWRELVDEVSDKRGYL